MKYINLITSKDYNIDLFIETVLNEIDCPIKNTFNNNIEKQDFIVKFLKEFNINYNNPEFITNIFYLLNPTDFTTDFIFHILNKINDHTINLTYKTNPSLFLQLIGQLGNNLIDSSIIENLLDRGALINDETNNINHNVSALQNINHFYPSTNLAKDYIRILQKLRKAGGKITENGIQSCFFNQAKQFKLPMNELKKVLNYFICELNIPIDKHLLKELLKSYSEEEQGELKTFLLDNFTIEFIIDKN